MPPQQQQKTPLNLSHTLYTDNLFVHLERCTSYGSLIIIPIPPRNDKRTRNPHRNHSSGSMSETGSLDRMKAAAERRKKGMDETTGPTVSGRVEGTRVNPDSLIDELLKNTKLDQLEESAESKQHQQQLISLFYEDPHLEWN